MTKDILSYVNYLCGFVLLGGLIYLLYKRSVDKMVSLKMISSWLDENKGIGKVAFVSLLSVLPDDVKDGLHKEIGSRFIINGYKDETSVLVTIIDESNEIIKSYCFWGTKIDEELSIALGEKGLKIKL